jgi:FlaA1/EpsC-like NDP-sugar epimerase
MTRFWIDIKDAARFILERYDTADHNLPMIPSMKACRVVKIAELCARYLGINDFKIEYTGIRAGEKIHEALFTSHEVCVRSDTCPQYTDDEILTMIGNVP